MTQVVIDDVIPRTQIVATAGQTVFNTNWTADATTDVLVYARADGVPPNDVTQLVSSSLYNVTFIGGSQTVRVTFLSGRTLDDVITIVRNTTAERTNLYINTNFVPSMLNQDFGILTLVDQQAQMYDTVVNPGYNVSAEIDTADKVLPILEPLEVWRMNAAGTAIEAVTIGDLPPASTAPFVIYTAESALTNAQNLGLLTSGILKQSVSGGIATVAIAIPGVDYLAVGTPLGTMAFQNANNVNITGGSAALGSGSVATTPTSALDLVNKAYADSISAGFTFKSSCLVATTADLNATYANGAAGIGATLTCNVNGVLLVDGVNPVVTDRILVKNQATTFENGVYAVTVVGTAGTPFVLTRATDFDSPAEIQPGSIIFIQSGASFADTSFVETEVVIAVGTSPVLFVQFSQTYPLAMGSGGTGSSITPIANAVFSTTAGSVGQLSTTLPAGLTIPGYAHSGANSDITSMSGLTGALRAPTMILDTNGNEVLVFTGVASAVNELTVTNAATGNGVLLSATGGDANIGLISEAKGTGQIIERSANTTTPIVWKSGTTLQHTTNFLVADTAQTRNVTFQDASGTLAFLGDVNTILIASATAANSVTIDLTGMTGFTHYTLYYNNLTPVTNTTNLLLRVSTDNGSSFSSATYRYVEIIGNAVGAAAVAGAGATEFLLAGSFNNTASNGGAGKVDIINPAGGAFTSFTSLSYMTTGAGAVQSAVSNGQWATTTTVNAIRLLMSAGNISTGRFYLYGVK